MSEWIEINLPYSADGNSNLKYPSFSPPDLNERALKELGFVYKDVDALHNKLSEDRYSDPTFCSILEKAESILRDKNLKGAERAQLKIKLLRKSKHKTIKTLADYIEKEHQYDDWYKVQPEFIAYNKEYNKKLETFNKKVSKKSFSGLGLAKPGTLIEVEYDGKLNQYLIGHINDEAGICDDCKAFIKNKTIVKRYKIVWQE